MSAPSNEASPTSRPTYRFSAWIVVGLLMAGACSRNGIEDPVDAPTPHPPKPPMSAPLRERVDIPAGSFSSGTEPGRFERRPELEPRLTRSALGAFAIDTEPYSDGTGMRLLGLGREQAAERCAERSGRLCTELEWERACKGPRSHPFPNGVELDPTCAVGRGCASGFGVWGMGSLREWTASSAPGRSERTAIVRGAPASAPVGRRRCAHRETAPVAPEPQIGFRCCYGPPNAARVILPRLGRSYAKAELSLADLGRWLSTEPATAAIARDLAYFDEATATARVLERGRDRAGVLFTSAPLAWNPAAGVELLVVAARSGQARSFVVVLDALGDGSRRVASSFIMEEEPGPVVLAYDPSVRARLQFSTCWGCAGETGRILYSDPDRALIVQP